MYAGYLAGDPGIDVRGDLALVRHLLRLSGDGVEQVVRTTSLWRPSAVHPAFCRDDGVGRGSIGHGRRSPGRKPGHRRTADGWRLTAGDGGGRGLMAGGDAAQGVR